MDLIEKVASPPSDALTDGALGSRVPGRSRATAMEPLLLRPEEAARLLDLGRSTLYQLIGGGELPSVTIGRARRIPLAALRAWIAARTSGGIPSAPRDESASRAADGDKGDDPLGRVRMTGGR